jgi:NADPH:quinone reductase-like Zn-dependent oxidoreductase
MPISSTGWFLHRATPDQNGKPATLIQEDFQFADIAADEVLAEPLYGCWEGNMEHSLSRRPIDICHMRNEERVIIGNAGIVRVLSAGSDVRGLKPGQAAIVFSSSMVDRFGYPERMLAYDAAGTMGCMATRIKLKERELIPVPSSTRHSLARWAAFSVRHITAWSNWELAFGTFRLLIGAEELAHPHVWGWGGGTTLAQLQLAQRQGGRVMMISGNDAHLAEIRQAGVPVIDWRSFGQLFFDDKRYAEDREFRRAYMQAEQRFLREVEEKTGGEKVQIFVDYLGGPVFRATCKALSREGIITTAGWKEGMNINYLRSLECIERHQFIHTHYARYSQAAAAVAYGEEHDWMPMIDERIYRFDEIPQLAESFRRGETGYFPVYSINAE